MLLEFFFIDSNRCLKLMSQEFCIGAQRVASYARNMVSIHCTCNWFAARILFNVKGGGRILSKWSGKVGKEKGEEKRIKGEKKWGKGKKRGEIGKNCTYFVAGVGEGFQEGVGKKIKLGWVIYTPGCTFSRNSILTKVTWKLDRSLIMGWIEELWKVCLCLWIFCLCVCLSVC